MPKIFVAAVLVLLMTVSTQAASKPTSPRLGAPKARTAFAVNATPTLKWQTSNANKYTLEVFDASGTLIFSQIVWKAGCVNNLCAAKVSTPLALGQYRWRVTATNKQGSTTTAQRMFGVYPLYAVNLLKQVNNARCTRGLAPLAISPQLNEAANLHSMDMGVNMTRNNPPISHYGSNGTNPIERANQAGYPSGYVSENIAAGAQNAGAVFKGWMNSAGHRANILDPNAREMGIALYYATNAPYNTYWTQMFGQRNNTVLGVCP